MLSPAELAAVRAACAHRPGAYLRWAALAARGASDLELLACLGRELQTGAMLVTPVAVRWKIGPPRVWVGADANAYPAAAPTLSGPELLAVVRALFNIRSKNAEDLFPAD